MSIITLLDLERYVLPGNIVTLEGDVRLEPNKFSNASPADIGGETGFSIG